jgi:hypothetical protein
LTTLNFSQGLRTRNAYIAETTWATVPATPAMSIASATKMGLAYTANEIKDTAIRSDRMQRYSLTGNKNIAGDIEMKWYANGTSSPADDLMSSLLRGAWVSNSLVVGTTESSFVFEEGNLDTTLFRVFTGVKADKAKIVFGGGEGLTVTFSCTGHDMQLATAPITGATYSTEPVATPMLHFNGSFTEGGAACAYLTGLTIDLDAGQTPNFALGDQYVKSLTPGMLHVTGTGTAYFPDHTLYTKFVNGTQSSMSASSGDGTHTRTFTLPNIKYTAITAAPVSAGPVIQNFSFSALYDTSTSTVITVART